MVRGTVSILALGVCLGLIAGMLLAPRSGADVRKFVIRRMQSATSALRIVKPPEDELAEDLSY